LLDRRVERLIDGEVILREHLVAVGLDV